MNSSSPDRTVCAGVEDGENDIDHSVSNLSDESGSDGDASDDVQAEEASRPLHREVYAPFVWNATLDHLAPNPYKRLDPLHRSDDEDNDVLDDVDDTALADELIAEEELDVVDLAAASEAEAALWAKFGARERDADEIKRSTPEKMDVVPVENKEEGCVRNVRYRKAGGRIKSSVFVEDSD